MNIDLARVAIHAKTAWEALHPNAEYSMVSSIAPHIEPGITEGDIAAINQIFYKPQSPIERRVKEAHLARLRRIARLINVQEEGIMAIDVRTRIAEIENLHERLKTSPGPKWKSKSRPWDILLHYCYRVPVRTGSTTTSINMEIYRECVGWPASNSYHPNTGWRVFLAPGFAREQTVGRIVAHASKWFAYICILTTTESVVFKHSEAPALPNPMESQVFDCEIEVAREKIIQVLRAARPEMPPQPALRIFTYYRNAKNFDDGEFVPWPANVSYRTRSGTILIGWATFLFRVDLHAWTACPVDIYEQRSARRVTAKHYRHRRGMRENT